MSAGFRVSQGFTYSLEFISNASPEACCEQQWGLNLQAGAPGWYGGSPQEELTTSCAELYSYHAHVCHLMGWTIQCHSQPWSYLLLECCWRKPYTCCVSTLRRMLWHSSSIPWPHSTSANWWSVSSNAHYHWLQWKTIVVIMWIWNLTAGDMKCEARMSEVLRVCVRACWCFAKIVQRNGRHLSFWLFQSTRCV